jgi:hypothetical protein
LTGSKNWVKRHIKNCQNSFFNPVLNQKQDTPLLLDEKSLNALKIHQKVAKFFVLKNREFETSECVILTSLLR